MKIYSRKLSNTDQSILFEDMKIRKIRKKNPTYNFPQPNHYANETACYGNHTTFADLSSIISANCDLFLLVVNFPSDFRTTTITR